MNHRRLPFLTAISWSTWIRPSRMIFPRSRTMTNYRHMLATANRLPSTFLAPFTAATLLLHITLHRHVVHYWHPGYPPCESAPGPSPSTSPPRRAAPAPHAAPARWFCFHLQPHPQARAHASRTHDAYTRAVCACAVLTTSRALAAQFALCSDMVRAGGKKATGSAQLCRTRLTARRPPIRRLSDKHRLSVQAQPTPRSCSGRRQCTHVLRRSLASLNKVLLAQEWTGYMRS